jgi:hypothetical protein
MVGCVSIALVLVIVPVWSASAQVKQWTDEKGVTHFEAHGKAQPAPRATDRSTAPGKTTTAIDRSHAGVTLGEVDTSVRDMNRWMAIGQDKFGAAGFMMRIAFLPPGVTKLSVLSVDNRLSSIHITYNETALGGWNQAIATLKDKYGPPYLTAAQANWADGQTSLRLEKDYRGGILAVIVDSAATNRYRARAGYDSPKF